jgi:hypothetical protein
MIDEGSAYLCLDLVPLEIKIPGGMEMKHHRLMACLIVLACLVPQACSEDYLNPFDASESAAAMEEIKKTMQSEIFNIGQGGMSAKTSFETSVSARRELTKTGAKETVSLTGSQPAQGKAGAKPADVAGIWMLELTDSTARSVNLSLVQSGDVVFGSGNMTSGSATQMVAASGSAEESKLSLGLISVSDPGLYKLVLDLSKQPVSGDYEAFSPGMAPWNGTAKASRSAKV